MQRRRRPTTGNSTLWFAQGIIGVFRIVFRIKEVTTTNPAQRERLQAFREQMENVEQGKREMLRKLHEAGDAVEKLELVEAFEERFFPETDRSERRAFIEEMRASRDEVNTLKRLHDEAANPQEAVISLRAHTIEHPRSEKAYTWLGIALLNAGEPQQAVEAYRESLRLTETQAKKKVDFKLAVPMAHLHLASALLKAGKLTEAEAECRLVLSMKDILDNVVCTAYMHLGEVLQVMGDRTGAREAWKQVIRLDETKHLARYARQMLQDNP